MNRIFRNVIFYLLIFLVIIGIVSIFQADPDETEQITFNEFQQELENDNIESLTIQPTLDVYAARGQLRGAEEDEFFTVNVPDLQVFLEEVITSAGEQGIEELVIEQADEPSGWVNVMIAIIPFVIIFILFFFLLSQAQGGGGKVMNFGKSKAKLVSEDKKKAR
ncbi:ATP-dependent metallopeptidase FtsH/Yme1/Tma family protein, partial [Alkalicoccus luteus]